jgi:hypothetical protein
MGPGGPQISRHYRSMVRDHFGGELAWRLILESGPKRNRGFGSGPRGATGAFRGKSGLFKTTPSHSQNFRKTSATEIVAKWLAKVSWGLNHLQTNSISFTHISFQVSVSMISSNFDQSSSEVNSGKTRAHFEKPKEVYTHHGPKNNNLSHISHSCYILGESRTSWNLIFPDSRFFCWRHLFQMQIPDRWRKISQNRERFLLKTS